MIFANFTHPPQPNDGAVLPTCAQTVATAVAKFPGFAGYILHNPDQWNSEGVMGYPYGLDGQDWKNAHAVAGNLWARIGGCKPHDLPAKDGPIDTLAKKLRPSTAVLLDYGSGQGAEADYGRFRRIFQNSAAGNSLIVAPEANARRAWITGAANVWLTAEWFHCNDVAVPNATNDCDDDRWSVRDWLATHPETKFVVEITTDKRADPARKLGFCPTADCPNPCPDWSAARVEIAKAFHSIDPKRVVVSVRMTGMSPAQVAALRSLNG